MSWLRPMRFRNWNRRERAGMITVVSVLAAGTLGAIFFEQQQQGRRDGNDVLIPPPPPALAVSSSPARHGVNSINADAASSVTIAAGQDSDSSAVIEADAPSAPEEPTTPTASQTLVVYITGAIKKPGVLRMRPGDRIYQAVDKAGGFKPGAVQEALNLADRLQDGDQIHIPSRREMAEASAGVTRTPPTVPSALRRGATTPRSVVSAHASGGASAAAGAARRTAGISRRPAAGRVLGRPIAPVASGVGSGAAANAATTSHNGDSGAESSAGSKFKTPGDGVVNINTAGADELQHLPRVGPVMANKILEYRRQIGRFTSLEQLMDVKGVGEKTFAKWQPFLTLE